MARLSDHDVRDAEHAARMELALVVGPYLRRMNESAKAHIQEDIEEAIRNGEDVDGTAIGRAAAAKAARHYFGGLAGTTEPLVIEGRAGDST